VPIYQYRCTKGHEFDVMQRMSEDPLTTCEVCGAAAARVLFAPAIHFKGSGFHNTDYGTRRRPVSDDNGSSGASTSSEGGSGNGSSGGGTSGSDSGSSSSSGESSGKSVGLDKV
jgi:putative FmdB family regulatory protein